MVGPPSEKLGRVFCHDESNRKTVLQGFTFFGKGDSDAAVLSHAQFGQPGKHQFVGSSRIMLPRKYLIIL